MTNTSPFALVLLSLSLPALAFAGEPAAVPPATPQQVHQSVDRAIGYLRTESASWLSTRKCAACHHAPMPLWALSEASQLGYSIDKKWVVDTAESILGSQENLMTTRLLSRPTDPPDTRPLARAVNQGLVFMAVAARALPALSDGQKQSLREIADTILKKQQPDGSWEFFLSRPPINENETTDAVWILLALQAQMEREPSETLRAAIQKGTTWLASAKLSDGLQDQVFKVLMAIRAGKPRSAVQRDIDVVLTRQRPDGGWSQTPSLKSDAFATGQTLYVLALAGYTADQPQIQRGINFLVSTQKPDGSWPMISRSSPDGKTGGSAKLLTPITCGAGSWATLGLARLVPKRP
jgi:hypothetical protein